MEQQEPKTAPEAAVPANEAEEAPFVPYVREAYQTNSKRKKIGLILLAVLALIAALLGGFILFARHFNFYRKTMDALQFDYRNGESMDEETKNDLAVLSEALAGRIGSTGTVHANVCVFNEKGALAATVSQYDYSFSPEQEELLIRTGSEDWFLTQNTGLRRKDGKVQEQKGNDWTDSDERFPQLYDFFFGTADHDNVKLRCADAYYTGVGSTTYVCELWLMETPNAYYTVYRYFNHGNLAAVRVLSSKDTLMEVYDITALDV